MFEKYTEQARRVIFFARHEASQLGSRSIEADHLLLALLRESGNLFRALYVDPGQINVALRREIEQRMQTKEQVPLNVDMPLSVSAKRVLSLAAEESDQMGHRHIGTEHLLLGLLREEKSIAAQVLSSFRLDVARVRKAVAERNENAPRVDGRPTLGAASEEIEALEERLSQLETSSRNENAVLWLSIYSLVELLVAKGVISDAEARELRERDRTSDD